MEEQTDQTFIKNVTIVITILILFTFTVAFIARDIGFKADQGNNPSSATLAEERIKPIARAYTGADGATAIEEAEAAPAPVAAFDGSLDAEMIYGSVCAACHAAGVAEAPIPGSDQMSQRADKGLDALMQSALNGLNAMPARGGRADLTDEQVQAVVEFMLQ